MSLTAEQYVAETAIESPAEPATRRTSLGKAIVAFVVTATVAVLLNAVGSAGMNQAIDNYYAKKAMPLAEPLPELVAALNATDEAPAAEASAQ